MVAGIRRNGSGGAVGHSDGGARHAALTMGRSFPAPDRYSVRKMHVCLLLIILCIVGPAPWFGVGNLSCNIRRHGLEIGSAVKGAKYPKLPNKQASPHDHEV